MRHILHMRKLQICIFFLQICTIRPASLAYSSSMQSAQLAQKIRDCGNKRALARVAGVSQRTIWRIANEGHLNITASIANRLSKALRGLAKAGAVCTD